MIQYIIRRLLGAVIVIFAVSLITFLIFQLAPQLSGTSPVFYYVGRIPPQPFQLKLLEHRFGFDLPWYEQYWHYIKGIVAGQTLGDGNTTTHCGAPCLGYSFRLNTSVVSLIKDAPKGPTSVDDWKKLDQAVMESATYLPLLGEKTLDYRTPRMTNVTCNNALAFGIYDFVNVGVS
jgi:hypothetical protein